MRPLKSLSVWRIWSLEKRAWGVVVDDDDEELLWQAHRGLCCIRMLMLNRDDTINLICSFVYVTDQQNPLNLRDTAIRAIPCGLSLGALILASS